MSSYTINTIANSSIVIDDEYERRSLANQGWELTDRPVLQSPLDGATGVSQDPTFDWAEYVKDIPITNLVYKLEVVAIASAGTTPNWTNAFVLVTESTSANLKEQLAAAQYYAWRVSALSRTLPSEFIDTFERASLGADYEDTTIDGVGNSSIVNNELVIELDATSVTSRQSLRLLKNFENPNILIKGIKFSNTTSDFQTVIYFNEQGTIQNNQMNGYYFYPLGDEIRMGKSVNYSPSDKVTGTFARVDDTPYNMRIQTTNGHARITLWNPATESEPSPQLDWTDSNSPYISGGLTFIPVAFGNATVEQLTIDDIEVTFAEGEVTTITGVTVDGSTSDLEEGQTRTGSATVEGTGNVQQSVDWSVNIGTIVSTGDNSFEYTADGATGSVTIVGASTQDGSVTGTLTFNVIAASTGTGTDSVQGDFDALQAIYTATQGQDLPTLSSTNDLPSLGNATYPFMYLISGEIHYMKFGRGQERESWQNAGAPWKDTTGWTNMTTSNMGDAVGVTTDSDGRVIDFDMQKVTTQAYRTRFITTGNNLCGELPPEVGNLKRCAKFNVKQNFLFGELPTEFGQIGTTLERLSLAGHHWEIGLDLNGKWFEAEHTHYANPSDPTDYIVGEKQVTDTNRFKSELPPEWGDLTNLDLIELNWQFLQGTLPSTWGNFVNMRGLFLDMGFEDGANALYSEIPSTWVNLTAIKHFKMQSYQLYERLHGTIPTGMFDFPNMVDCAIGDNNLEGTFPSFSGVASLFYFVVSRNNFGGDFPWESIFYKVNGVRQNANLNKFGISYNNFTGPISAEALQYPIAALGMRGNNFSGAIPPFWRQVITTDFSEMPLLTSHEEDMTYLVRPRALRWANCSMSGNIPNLDWYNFYWQDDNGRHPLRNFAYVHFQNNNYNTDPAIEEGFYWKKPQKYPWEIENKPMIWYYQNKEKDASGNCKILNNVDTGFTIQQYLNAGFSQDCINSFGGSTGYEFMTNVLNGAFDGYNEFII